MYVMYCNSEVLGFTVWSISARDELKDVTSVMGPGRLGISKLLSGCKLPPNYINYIKYYWINPDPPSLSLNTRNRRRLSNN